MYYKHFLEGGSAFAYFSGLVFPKGMLLEVEDLSNFFTGGCFREMDFRFLKYFRVFFF